MQVIGMLTLIAERRFSTMTVPAIVQVYLSSTHEEVLQPSEKGPKGCTEEETSSKVKIGLTCIISGQER